MKPAPAPKKQDPFKFLKEGEDSEFEKAMNSISSMYDDIFKSDTDFNSIFDGLRVENNPTLEPIAEMFNDVFQPEAVKDKKEFIKIDAKQAKELQYGIVGNNQKDDSDEESELVIGEPVYVNQFNGIWNKDL